MLELPVTRDYQKKDYPAVLKVWKETGMGGAERGDDEAVIQRTIESGGKLIVLLLGKAIIGTSWLTVDGRRIYLHHFGILPQWQGRGWSHILLRDSLEWARAQNMQIKLEVHQDNSAAVNLYRKSGFKYLGDYDVYIVRNPEELT